MTPTNKYPIAKANADDNEYFIKYCSNFGSQFNKKYLGASEKEVFLFSILFSYIT